jgi:hypothetical protein
LEFGSKPISTKEDMKNIPFQEVVGCLMYAMVCTRLDTSFAMGHVSKHVPNPCHSDWTNVKIII